jgi:hypothetical protein
MLAVGPWCRVVGTWLFISDSNSVLGVPLSKSCPIYQRR